MGGFQGLGLASNTVQATEDSFPLSQLKTGRNHLNCGKKLFGLEFFKKLLDYNSNETLEAGVTQKSQEDFFDKRCILLGCYKRNFCLKNKETENGKFLRFGIVHE